MTLDKILSILAIFFWGVVCGALVQASREQRQTQLADLEKKLESVQKECEVLKRWEPLTKP